MLNRLTDVLFPPVCVLCRDRLPSAAGPLCLRCRMSVEALACRRVLPGPERAYAAFRYEGAAREALLRFKYRDRHRLGPWLSARMAAAAREHLMPEQIDLVTAVPLHWLKRRLRGADPVASLGRAVAAQLDKPWRPDALIRRRWTVTQTRLSHPERRRNVAAAFHARPRDIAGAAVLLVDDVVTSGATSEACRDALRAAGAASVVVLTAADAGAA